MLGGRSGRQLPAFASRRNFWKRITEGLAGKRSGAQRTCSEGIRQRHMRTGGKGRYAAQSLAPEQLEGSRGHPHDVGRPLGSQAQPVAQYEGVGLA